MDPGPAAWSGPGPASPNTAASTQRHSRGWSRSSATWRATTSDPETFRRIKAELQHAQRPTHYLAIPPSMFPIVVEQLADAGCCDDARVVVEKPFGRSLETARALNQLLLKTFPEDVHLPDRSLPRERSGPEHPVFPLRQRVSRSDLEPPLRRERADHDGRGVRRDAAGASSTKRRASFAT